MMNFGRFSSDLESALSELQEKTTSAKAKALLGFAKHNAVPCAFVVCGLVFFIGLQILEAIR